VKITDFLQALNWIDGTPLWPSIEPYRRRILEQANEQDATGAYVRNLILCGRGKKNWKTTDLVLGGLFALLDDSPHGNTCSLYANDED
jgi:hypothetical protein